MWQEMPREMQAVRKRLACTSAEGLLRSATRFGVAGGVPTCETPPDEFDGTLFFTFHLAKDGGRLAVRGEALPGLVDARASYYGPCDGMGRAAMGCDGLRWSRMRRGMSVR
jgi:hypothetical protein